MGLIQTNTAAKFLEYPKIDTEISETKEAAPMDPNQIAFNTDVQNIGMLKVYQQYIKTTCSGVPPTSIAPETVTWLDGHAASDWIMAAAATMD